MRKRLLKVMLGLSIAGIGVYAIYNYSLNVIGNKISDHLLAEAANDSPWLDRVNASGLSAPSGQDIQQQSTIDNLNITARDQEISTIDHSKSHGEEQSGAPIQEPLSSESPQKPVSSTSKKSLDNKGLAFESKQEAIKFVMGRFSVSEINHIRQIASGDLTSENKAELMKIAYSKFTSSEIEAVRRVVATK
ncbi:hypothetical protein [Paenibacillus sp. N3.4]|uniref:hypothetical protein n=1 Tax=Paenibacillus sp. N3.4 TaxID=2603222 RepID=UPI0011CA1F16|nr:hypothetical protein [Paenibacillus sp. N3.4]TXK77953.1 hypothetical protein FU659_21425 [Paenibacillus sp. N3.4]